MSDHWADSCRGGTRRGHEERERRTSSLTRQGATPSRREAPRGEAALGGTGACVAWAPAGVGTDGTESDPWQSETRGQTPKKREAVLLARAPNPAVITCEETERGRGPAGPASRLRLSRANGPERTCVLPSPRLRKNGDRSFRGRRPSASADGWPARGRPAGGGARARDRRLARRRQIGGFGDSTA